MALVRLAPASLGGAARRRHARRRSSSAATRCCTKVFPGALSPDEIYARLREPFGYWNAVGLMAALGVPGVPVARRAPHGPRGAQRAGLPGARRCCWSCCCSPTRAARCSRWRSAARSGSRVVPLRLRGARVLGASGARRGCWSPWAFSQDGADQGQRRRSPQRTAPGTSSALVLVVLLARAAGRRAGDRLRDRARAPPAAAAPPRRRRGRSSAARARAGRRRRGLRARPTRAAAARSRKGWSELTDPNARDAGQRPGPADRRRQRARALLERGAEDLQGAPGARRRRGRLRDRAAALPQRRRSTSATRTATSCRRWPTSGSSGCALSLALLVAPGSPPRRTAAGSAAPRARGRRSARARRAADAAARRRRLRRALVRRLDVVRARATRSSRCCAPAGSRAAARSTEPVAAAAGCATGRRAHGARAAAAARRGAGAAGRVGDVAAAARRCDAGDEALDAPRGPTPAPGPRAARARPHDADPLSVEPLSTRGVETTAGTTRRRARRWSGPSAASRPTRTRGCAWPTSSVAADRPAAARRAVGAALYLDPRSPEGQALFLEALRRTGAQAAPGALAPQQTVPPAAPEGDPGEGAGSAQPQEPSP